MRKITRRRIRATGDGMNVVSDVNAVVASNTGRNGGRTSTSTRQRVRVVQRNGHTLVTEENDREEQEEQGAG